MSDLSWGLKSQNSMVPKPSQRPSISFRPIQPSDLEIVERIHCDLFPIRQVDWFLCHKSIGFILHCHSLASTAELQI